MKDHIAELAHHLTRKHKLIRTLRESISEAKKNLAETKQATQISHPLARTLTRIGATIATTFPEPCISTSTGLALIAAGLILDKKTRKPLTLKAKEILEELQRLAQELQTI